MSGILDASGAPIAYTPKKDLRPRATRAERRRFARDPDRRNKTIAGADGVPDYYRLIAYGQILVAEMLEIQSRMGGIDRARARRPKGLREELQEELTAQWNETVEKFEAVQGEITIMEELKELSEHPGKEAEVYGLC